MRPIVTVSVLMAFLLSACGDTTPEMTSGVQFKGQPIYGGSLPDDPRYDAVVGMYIYETSGTYICSGTLIAPDVVLTAAHCFVTKKGKRITITPPENVDIFFGAELGGTAWPVSEVYVHPGYDPGDFGVNDLTLLRLATPGPSAPITWLPASMGSLETVGTPVLFAGYGATETGTIGTKLWVDGSIAGVTSTGLMNEQDDWTGTCGGDSGGPLIYDFGGTWYVGGTTSWGDSACTDYGWSMRVSAFDSWVTGFVGATGCTGDAECDDGDACTDDVCVAGACVNTAMDCDDGNACTDDACVGGTCTSGSVNCDDGNVCTDDSCDPASGCGYVDNTNLCDDGDECTLSDACSGGVCTGDLAPECMCGAKRDACTVDADCCSNRCKRGVCR